MTSKVRATKVKDVSAEHGRPAWEYSDGSVRGEKGHMITPLPGVRPITVENRAEIVQQGLERKHEIAVRAANEAVERGDFRTKYGDWASFAERVQAAQRKATNIDDPKAIDAARYLDASQGIAERTDSTLDNASSQQLAPWHEALTNITATLRALAEHAAARHDAMRQDAGIVDGRLVDDSAADAENV